MNNPDPVPVPDAFDDWLYAPPALPVEPLIPAWMWWVLIGLVIVSGLYITSRVRRQMRIPLSPSEPRNEALESLDGLKARVATLPPVEMASELAATVNRYLHRRYGELAGFRTRDEVFVPELRPAGAPPLPPGVSKQFSDLMERCEEMRFAGRDRAKAECKAVVDATVDAIRGESPLGQQEGQSNPVISSTT